jgi:hypothetical protein
MDSASTADSLSITVEYDLITPPDSDHPLVFGVYRSADGRFDAGDVAVGDDVIGAPGQVLPALDLDGQPAALPGHHRLTFPLPGGLPPDPEHPFVLVVADPTAAQASGEPPATASFRTYVIGVVTHGGFQDKHRRIAPEWEVVMASSLRREGYDAVIPFNWVSQSNHPGAAAREGARLARRVLAVSGRFPGSDPIDLHFIGHSEGTVVNSQAIIRLESKMPPRLRAGYLKVTMLDPHAANTGVRGQQYSVARGVLGWLAKAVIDDYQSRAKDPRAIVPPGVDDAEVFYQHTPASRSHGVNGGVYNLWGQVPVQGPAHYFNLTADGATHSGKTGVAVWYLRNVVPLLGDGAPEVRERILTGELDDGTVAPGTTAWRVTLVHRPLYSGTALPGSTVYLFGGPARSPAELVRIARTVADPDGHWRAQAPRLADGRYRIVAVAVPPRHPDQPRLAMLPTAPLPLLVVAARSGA